MKTLKTYCFRTCLSISHSADNQKEHAQVHTVEIATYISYIDGQGDLKQFHDAEKIIDSLLKEYQEAYLNELEGFETDTRIEHLGEVLYFRLHDMLKKYEMSMERFEISETPLRTYIITTKV